MCEICDGAKSTSEMPCSKVLTEFGKILYQVVGDGAAAQMAMQTTGGLHSPSEKGREVYGNLLYGIHLGRAEEIRTERKQHRRDRWFAVELNVFSLVFGTVLGAADGVHGVRCGPLGQVCREVLGGRRQVRDTVGAAP